MEEISSQTMADIKDFNTEELIEYSKKKNLKLVDDRWYQDSSQGENI